MILKDVAKVVVFASAFLGMPAAHAALITCPPSFTADGTAKVTGLATTDSAAAECEYIAGDGNDAPATIGNINDAEFFGSSNWTVNTGNNQVDTNNMSAGSWAISNPDFNAFDYMIVFKSGQGTNLIGFLFNGEYTTGNWTTPFTDPPFDLPGNSRSKDVSHYTIVQRPDTPTDMPEPGMLSLLGIGLVGYGAVRRRALKK